MKESVFNTRDVISADGIRHESEKKSTLALDGGRFEILEGNKLRYTVSDNGLPPVVYNLPKNHWVERRLNAIQHDGSLKGEDFLTVVRLDKWTAALASHTFKRDGTDQLLFFYRFSLKDPDDLAVMEKDSSVTITEAEVSRSLKEEWGFDALHQKPDEDGESYMQRLIKSFHSAQQSKDIRKRFADLGVSLENFNWSEQLGLINSYFELGGEKVEDFARKFGAAGLRCLVGLEYGAIANETVLRLAERLDQKQAQEIFQKFSILKDQVYRLGRVLEKTNISPSVSFDQKVFLKLPSQLQEGLLRRGKDMLVAADAIALNGQVEVIAFGNRKIKSRDIGEVAYALTAYGQAIEKAVCLIDGQNYINCYQFKFLSSQTNSEPEVYEFEVFNTSANEKSYFTLQLREWAVAVGQHNAGMEFDGEARINLLFSNQPISRYIEDPSRQQALSLRIDREGKQREGENIVSNDPTKREGELSLEVGGFAEDGDVSDSAVVGKIISIGNALATQTELGQKAKFPQYYHNRDSFAREFGDARIFSEIVKFIREKIRQYYS